VCYNAKFGCSRSNGTKVLCYFSIYVISTCHAEFHPVKKIVPAALIRLQPSKFAYKLFCRHCITIWDRISASVHLLYLSRPPTILLQSVYRCYDHSTTYDIQLTCSFSISCQLITDQQIVQRLIGYIGRLQTSESSSRSSRYNNIA